MEGYRDFCVQDLIVKSHTTLYCRAVYRLPDGGVVVASRPAEIDSHFGAEFRRHVLWQVDQNHVTQGRLLEELWEFGIDISAGQISNILLNGHEAFLFGAGKILQEKMAVQPEGCWMGRAAWERQLNAWKVKSLNHRILVSEAALCGTLLTESWYEQLGLVSDDAPQFKVFGFVHGLCWIHGERKIDRIIPLTAVQRTAKENAQTDYWAIYDHLKKYRENPTETDRQQIESSFDKLCQTKTASQLISAIHNKRPVSVLWVGVEGRMLFAPAQ